MKKFILGCLFLYINNLPPQDAKNEAETYMLKELSLLRWKEKAIKFASDDAISHAVEIKNNASNLEESLKNERSKILGQKLIS